MTIAIARATGWKEQDIIWMPLRRGLQYLHAAWLAEGVPTEWRTLDTSAAETADALMARLRYLTRPQ